MNASHSCICHRPALRLFRSLITAMTLLYCGIAQAGSVEQNLMHLLDYVGADYAVAVADGRIINAGEYGEMQEFSEQINRLIAQLPDNPGKSTLASEAQRLDQFITAKRAPAEVATLTRGMRETLITAYHIETAPRSTPDLAAGARMYAEQCAGCHGTTGLGDGPQALGLEPAPTNFRDGAWRAQRSLLGLYNTITLGVEGTTMASYGHLDDDLRWALAFYVGSLASNADEQATGAALWVDNKHRGDFGGLARLTNPAPAQLDADGAALLAYLGAHPELIAGAGDAPLAFSVRALGESLNAYLDGNQREAQDLAVTAYLEGFELVEGPLGARDRDLVGRIEQAMIAYRAQLKNGAPADAVKAQATQIQTLLQEADSVLNGADASASMNFFSSFIILLREGLEAILVLAAIAAFLIKTGRRDAMPYLHTGWISALLLGGLTWVLASNVITISGSSRELTEGVAALVAAAMLIYIGYWLHSKANAARWKDFIESQIKSALTSRTLWAMALVSFLAVYREAFETVLFYQALLAQAGESGQTSVLYGMFTAAAVLLLLIWLIFKLSLRLPLRLFFTANSVLLYALAVIFTGKGIAALQEAGKLSVSPVNFPKVDLLGIYPNSLGLTLQALLVLTALGYVTYRYVTARPALDAAA